MVSSSSSPTERISSFVDSLLQPIAQKQESYLKDTTHFISFIENTQISDHVVLANLDVSSLYTNLWSFKQKGLTLFAVPMRIAMQRA